MRREKFRRNFIPLIELEDLVEEANSCIYLQTAKEHLALHPYHLANLNGAIKHNLHEKTGKYFANLDGIFCGFRNMKILSKTGQISGDTCFIHVDIEADFFIFKPELQKILTGVVNKKSKDHIGCLVHNVFNVSLPKPKNCESWVGHTLGIDSEVEFKITSTNFDGKLPYIKGEITSVIKEVPDVRTKSEEKSTSDESTKKRRRSRRSSLDHSSENKDDQTQHENVQGTAHEESPEKKKSKKKMKEVD